MDVPADKEMVDSMIRGMVGITMRYMCKKGWMAMKLMMKTKYEMLEMMDMMIKE